MSSRPFIPAFMLFAFVSLMVALPHVAHAQTDPPNVRNLNIGFNGADFSGPDDQLPYIDQFYGSTKARHSGQGRSMPDVRRCHAYVSWDVAEEPVGSGSDSSQGSRVWLQDWLQAYAGHCDQALITFKWVVGVSCHYYTGCSQGTDVEAVPQPVEVGNALKAFLATSWPGWTGSFAFTPWNEPNNAAASGDGFNNKIKISPQADADFYLAMRYYCTPSQHCEIAAGDFSSNGNAWEDYVQKCADDTTSLCVNGSYMDTLKYYLDHDATTYGLPAGFRPEYFAYHAWSDANDYLHYLQNPGSTTNCYTVTSADCVTRLVYEAFSTDLYVGNSSWTDVNFWDTEVGAGQAGNTYTVSPTNDQQAQTAAFLLNLTGTVSSSRFWRLYYTRIWEPDGMWWSMFCSDGSAKPSFAVWVNRETSYTPTGSACPAN
ncbi:hypothetical protein GCM10011507_17020 [Edaphobacter acidisoli]|uniref:Uncharacterized protein n=2 Tax=Edaphobacter acidisoli TaxID=2040573 RepID=A0A916W523_9BACT|nr:hypothetical protein GCM10011507_17020 [Edaphobacter acidisoli]